jgi:hypothetical protein
LADIEIHNRFLEISFLGLFWCIGLSVNHFLGHNWDVSRIFFKKKIIRKPQNVIKLKNIIIIILMNKNQIH